MTNCSRRLSARRLLPRKDSRERSLSVKLEFSGDVLKIMASSSAGITYDEVTIEHEGEDILIGFNNRFLMNNVRACSGEHKAVALKSPHQHEY